MNDVVRDYEDHGGPLGSSVVVACSVHEPAVLRAVIGGNDVDDATLREVDEAMECPACRLLLALASGDPAFIGRRPKEGSTCEAEKVVPFPAKTPRVMSAQKPMAISTRRVVVVHERLAASADSLCVGPEVCGRFQFHLGPQEPSDRRATIEVRVGRRTSIGVRWVHGYPVRLKGGGALLGPSSISVPAQPRRKVRQVLEEALEWAD